MNTPPGVSAHFFLWLRRNMRSVLIGAGLFGVALTLNALSAGQGHSDFIRGGGGNAYGEAYQFFGGAVSAGSFLMSDSVISGPEASFHIAAVADLDKRSKHDSGKEWFSIMTPGLLKRTSTSSYSLTWRPEDDVKLTTKHNEGGRGMELSELTVYDGRLLSFGDRTGIVFEFVKDEKKGMKGVPRFILTEGNGETDKGMKVEWSTVKDGHLYIGSFGKEFTNEKGEIVNTNNNWIVAIDHQGKIKRYDWTNVYNKVRKAAGAESPGYLVHEAVLWSESQKKWMFLPRRVSKEQYDDVTDERKGSNIIIVADDSFRNIEVITIKLSRDATEDGLHGFSSFAFVPGTGDRHAIAMRSVEEDCTGDDDEVCKQRSYACVFDTVTGDVLMHEQPMSDKYKFEGVEFVKI
mmetsp:Transcript_13538/g.26881  ORF Transcript_13538/g.26881 Transcript_13538/m.26881 type:complete len:405 (+) Transcript_13538:455-1669(+)